MTNSIKYHKLKYKIVTSKGIIVDTFRYIYTAKRLLPELEKQWLEELTIEEII